MRSYPQIANANGGNRPVLNALVRLPLSTLGKHPYHSIFAIPVLNRFLIYAPLHNLAALVDHTAVLCLRDSLLSGEGVGEGQLGEIVRTFNAGAEPAPSPKQGDFGPAFLGLLPTRGCNLSCRYCGFLTLNDSQKVMDLKLARDAVNWYMDLVSQTGASHAEIHYFGGEPFCVEEVLDLTVHLARTRAEGAGCTVRFEVATNGIFSEERCRWAADNFPLRRHRARLIEEYLALLRQEMCLWSRLGTLAQRPVSTVHFGGGTPTFLGEEPFSRLAQDLCENFRTGPQTEWALESTSSELTEEMFSSLNSLGFTRLHVGVQSLQDHVRRISNRREPAAIVLERIVRAVEKGWVVSVDLILGLPGQTLEGALDDVKALEAVGVDGFSLYELQLSSRNRSFAQQHGLVDRNRLVNYFLLQGVSRLLASLGYRKTLFNHFARQRDTNLYFTFPERGEDCLALGTIADGVFGDYHYRHPEYKPYCQSVNETFPGLQGGLRRTVLENRLFPLEIALLSASISPRLFADVLGGDRSEALLRRWQEVALIKEDPLSDHLCLTANGSWFVSKMMADLLPRQSKKRGPVCSTLVRY